VQLITRHTPARISGIILGNSIEISVENSD
jgi:hypothetical protein